MGKNRRIKKPGQGVGTPSRQIEDTVREHGTHSNNTSRTPGNAKPSLVLVIRRAEYTLVFGSTARVRSTGGVLPLLDWTIKHTYHAWDE